jgi:hypothetical protein
MPKDKKKARMLMRNTYCCDTTITVHNNCLSFRQVKCGESHMTYLARKTVKGLNTNIFHRFHFKNKTKNWNSNFFTIIYISL